MNQSDSKSAQAPWLWLALLMLGAALATFAGYGFWGFHPSDDGVVLAHAWRVWHGEMPYRDFVYVRTPLTPLLHTGWLLLPESFQFLAARLGFYLQMTLAMLPLTLWALRRGLVFDRVYLAIFSLMFWFLGIHVFPPMPWTTVDGVMWASLGAACLLWSLDRSRSRGAVWGLGLLAGLGFTLAALSKQNFAALALLPLVAWLAGWLAAEQDAPMGRNLARLLAPWLVMALAGAALAGWLALNKAWEPFVAQVLRGQHNASLADVGLNYYLPWLRYAMPGLAFLAWLYTPRRGLPAWAKAVVEPVLMAALLWPLAAFGLELGRASQPICGYVKEMGRALWWLAASLGLALYLAPQRADRLARPGGPVLIAAILLIAWASSISTGWSTPLLGMGAAGVILAMAFERLDLGLISRYLGIALSFICAVVLIGGILVYNRNFPYLDQGRPRLTADLAQAFGKFGRLYSHADNQARHAELARLLRELPKRYPGRRPVVVGKYPLAYYLAGMRNPTSLDWWEPMEFGGQQRRLAAELRSPERVIIADCPGAAGPPDPNLLPVWQPSQFTILEKHRFFCVYSVVAPRPEAGR